MERIIARALAKVNLALNITGKANDGYHEMQSIFAFLKDVYDELTFYPELEFGKNSAVIPDISNNLILQAWDILKNNFDFKVPHVEIKKNIPICGGLGGGSSDAACFINAIFDLWEFSQSKKMSYIDLFRPLGADAKVFLFKYFTNSRFVYINGTGLDGEILNINLPFSDEYILVINDGTKLSTKKVFDNFKEHFCKKIAKPEFLLKNPENSLQNSALELAPHLKKVLNLLARLSPITYGISGSGATCYAVVKSTKIPAETMNYTYVALSRF